MHSFLMTRLAIIIRVNKPTLHWEHYLTRSPIPCRHEPKGGPSLEHHDTNALTHHAPHSPMRKAGYQRAGTHSTDSQHLAGPGLLCEASAVLLGPTAYQSYVALKSWWSYTTGPAVREWVFQPGHVLLPSSACRAKWTWVERESHTAYCLSAQHPRSQTLAAPPNFHPNFLE